MPLVLLFIGILLVTVAVRDQQQQFVALLGDDFSGPGNFLYWVVALTVIGAIGYIPKARPVANMLLALILIVLILKRGDPATNIGGGVFQQLQAALSSTKQASAAGLASSSSTVGSTVAGLINRTGGL